MKQSIVQLSRYEQQYATDATQRHGAVIRQLEGIDLPEGVDRETCTIFLPTDRRVNLHPDHVKRIYAPLDNEGIAFINVNQRFGLLTPTAFMGEGIEFPNAVLLVTNPDTFEVERHYFQLIDFGTPETSGKTVDYDRLLDSTAQFLLRKDGPIRNIGQYPWARHTVGLVPKQYVEILSHLSLSNVPCLTPAVEENMMIGVLEPGVVVEYTGDPTNNQKLCEGSKRFRCSTSYVPKYYMSNLAHFALSENCDVEVRLKTMKGNGDIHNMAVKKFFEEATTSFVTQ